jgi:hypothetical protein
MRCWLMRDSIATRCTRESEKRGGELMLAFAAMAVESFEEGGIGTG